jgi:hypothetical protein
LSSVDVLEFLEQDLNFLSIWCLFSDQVKSLYPTSTLQFSLKPHLSIHLPSLP